MTIALVGTEGLSGLQLAHRLAEKGHKLLITDSVQGKSIDLKLPQESSFLPEAEVMTSPRIACWEADSIILAVREEEKSEVAEQIREVTRRKIVIDATERWRDLSNGGDPYRIGSFSQMLSHSRVAQIFIPSANATSFRTPYTSPTQCFVASDSVKALHDSGELISTAGYLPVIAGTMKHPSILNDLVFRLTYHSLVSGEKKRIWWCDGDHDFS